MGAQETRGRMSHIAVSVPTEHPDRKEVEASRVVEGWIAALPVPGQSVRGLAS